MLLDRIQSRLATSIRLIGLGLVIWSIATSGDRPGTSGRGLVVTVLLAIATIAWLTWTAKPLQSGSGDDRAVAVAIYVLAAAGGILTGAASGSAASAFVFVAVVAAGFRLEIAHAVPVPAVGTLALAIAVLVYDQSGLGLLAYTLGFSAALLAATNARQSRVRVEQAELLLAQTQRSREEQLRAVRLEESARLAREIHDLLAHALAGLTIQLEATRALVEGGADQATVLGRIEQAHVLAREGLRETRRAVGALREETIAVKASLEDLVGEYRSSTDAPATIAIDGDCSRLVGPIGLAIVRVTQEALTNVRKHAPGADVSVDLHAGEPSDREVVLVVRDREGDTPGRSPVADSLAGSGGGYGLRGMHERAEILGGTLSAGPDGEGWRVELRLPIVDTASSPIAGVTPGGEA